MNGNWQAVNALLSCALFNAPLVRSEGIEWAEVLRILRRQGITAFVSGASEVIAASPFKIRTCLKNVTEKQLYEYYRFLTEGDALTTLLTSQSIPFVILKGLSLARYYPHPEYRAVGDIDFLVSPRHFDSAKSLLLHNGYRAVYDDHVDDRHFVMEKNGIIYEMHRYFSMPKSKAPLKEMDKRLYEATLRAEILTKGGCSIPCLPKLEDGLVILQHISQHIQVGLTLRQVLDWIMYVDSVCDDAYWNDTFSAVAETYGLRPLALTVARMGQMYLGLPTEGFTWCSEADDDLCRDFMEYIVDTGSEEVGFAAKAGAAAFTGQRSIMSLLCSLQRYGKVNWAPTLEKRPYLRPFAWTYQLRQYMKGYFSRKNPFRSLKNDLKRAKRRVELYSKLKIK